MHKLIADKSKCGTHRTADDVCDIGHIAGNGYKLVYLLAYINNRNKYECDRNASVIKARK